MRYITVRQQRPILHAEDEVNSRLSDLSSTAISIEMIGAFLRVLLLPSSVVS
jgi:hypothetical protein